MCHFLIHIKDRHFKHWEIALRWIQQGITDDYSTFVQVIAWCLQATNYTLNQCWPSPLTPNGVVRTQWVTRSFTSRLLRQSSWVCYFLMWFGDKNGGWNTRALVRYKTWVTAMKIYTKQIMNKYCVHVWYNQIWRSTTFSILSLCVKLKQPLTVSHSLRQEYRTIIYLETFCRDIS